MVLLYLLPQCGDDCVQMADAMEMMILSILAPQLHCEWALPSWEVALLTSVLPLNIHSDLLCLKELNVLTVHSVCFQAVFIGMMISSSLWGNISDKYGRKTVRTC